ncbi:uncharacterized protein [Arachis hypogaea]|uniref:SWIM-type domain-containing protein n=1 Tax=Arachis hypogaea TaxID=3818 RepID=A0A445A2R0_ARAHY|nr:hypothetical protein Ahy_B03g065836 [Arachis hypogaea]
MAAKTKQEALSQIQGAFREQYKRINDYCHELLRTNPGSTVILKVIRSPDFAQERQNVELMNYCIFQRMYVCFDACKKSFQHCRRFIGLDGCFLKTPQGGQLLTAVGRDPNDQILPIAYAVVEAETKDSWVWFLRHLSDDLGPHNLVKCTFMSDQQKGLLPAFEEVIPGVDNRFCVRHLYSNFRKKFPGLELKNKMWRCAKASHWQSWEKEMKNLRVLNEGAFRHLNGIPPRFWSRSRFTFLSKCDSLVNNMSESFNAVLVEAREKPIVSMLKDIRVYMMTRWAANRERVLNYPRNIMPMITKKLEKWASLARDWRPYWSSASNYEVMCGLDKYVVDLATGECSCRTWQMSGIPCPHVISCITFKGLNLESYVAYCYKKEAYIKCYQEVIHPVNGPELWERTQYDDVIPPPYRRPSHRPVKKRKRGAADEDNRSQTHLSRRGEFQRCSNCGGVGHKKSGCSQPKKRAQSSTKRAKKNAPKLAPGQTAWGGRKRNTAPSPTNLPASHTRKTPTRPKKHEARPTTEAPQPKKASTKPKKASTQPNILAQTKNKAASSATSTSNKQPPSQPSVRKRPFSMIQCSAPHLPPSQWGNL